MNPCCEHLFREAKREIEIRDKRIIELQSECTRLFEPTREFWNMENQTRIENLIKENETLFETNKKLQAENERLQNYVITGYEEGIKELKAENAKLRDCVIFYADEDGQVWAACQDTDTKDTCCHMVGELSGGKSARQVLKELEKK